jgi:hypothetical protein
MEHRDYTQQKQQKYYWEPCVTFVNATIEITDNDKQEGSMTTDIPHMFRHYFIIFDKMLRIIF